MREVGAIANNYRLTVDPSQTHIPYLLGLYVGVYRRILSQQLTINERSWSHSEQLSIDSRPISDPSDIRVLVKRPVDVSAGIRGVRCEVTCLINNNSRQLSNEFLVSVYIARH